MAFKRKLVSAPWFDNKSNKVGAYPWTPSVSGGYGTIQLLEHADRGGTIDPTGYILTNTGSGSGHYTALSTTITKPWSITFKISSSIDRIHMDFFKDVGIWEGIGFYFNTDAPAPDLTRISFGRVGDGHSHQADVLVTFGDDVEWTWVFNPNPGGWTSTSLYCSSAADPNTPICHAELEFEMDVEYTVGDGMVEGGASQRVEIIVDPILQLPGVINLANPDEEVTVDTAQIDDIPNRPSLIYIDPNITPLQLPDFGTVNPGDILVRNSAGKLVGTMMPTPASPTRTAAEVTALIADAEGRTIPKPPIQLKPHPTFAGIAQYMSDRDNAGPKSKQNGIWYGRGHTFIDAVGTPIVRPGTITKDNPLVINFRVPRYGTVSEDAGAGRYFFGLSSNPSIQNPSVFTTPRWGGDYNYVVSMDILLTTAGHTATNFVIEIDTPSGRAFTSANTISIPEGDDFCLILELDRLILVHEDTTVNDGILAVNPISGGGLDLDHRGLFQTRTMIEPDCTNVNTWSGPYDAGTNGASFVDGYELTKNKPAYNSGVVDVSGTFQSNAVLPIDFPSGIDVMVHRDYLIHKGSLAITNAVGAIVGFINTCKTTKELPDV